MKRARVVIGANFGDEGKGLITDYLCAQGAGMVVRFNGGGQAGHTVVTPHYDNQASMRHVFRHFGSGTLLGIPTFLSQFFVCNPIVALKEADELIDLGINPIVYAHPNCLVTTFADMIINQERERALGPKRHGSTGTGFNETINRSTLPELTITMSDLWNGMSLEDKLKTICTKYAEYRTGKPIEDIDMMIAAFIRLNKKFADAVHPLGIAQCPDPVFEGAQGLMLDQNNRDYYPNLTRSNTGMKNVRILCAQAGIPESAIEAYYVSRTYLTRHGAGKLPGEDPKLSYEDYTNRTNEWQGALRFAPLDSRELLFRCRKDALDLKYKLAFTHCDQYPLPKGVRADTGLFSYGPTRNSIQSVAREP
jgi:adenylosuccinate synthase